MATMEIKKFELPSYQESERKLRDKSFNALHWYIHEWQPPDSEGANKFRAELTEAIKTIINNEE